MKLLIAHSMLRARRIAALSDEIAYCREIGLPHRAIADCERALNDFMNVAYCSQTPFSILQIHAKRQKIDIADNLMYVLRRHVPLQKAREEILAMTEWLHLVALNPLDVTRALSEEHPDFEDAVQFNCAAQWGADVIVTRNEKDFAHATVPVLTPEDFLERY